MSPAFAATRDEQRLIALIAQRALAADLYVGPGATQDAMMDIEAVHCNHCALDLQALANAPATHFNHDICGIQRHIDRNTGKLLHCFTPRYALREYNLTAPEQK